MVTEERVMSLLANADPSPDDEPSTDVDAVTYLANLEQRRSEVTQLDTRKEQRSKPRGQLWLGIAATVAVVTVVALVLLTSTDDTPPPATQPVVTTTVVPTTEPEASLDPQLEEALAVATAFTQARADRDFEAMQEHSIDGFIAGFLAQSYQLMPAEIGMARRPRMVNRNPVMRGDQLRLGQYARRSSVTVAHSNAISEALGRGSFRWNVFDEDQVRGRQFASVC